MGRQIVLWLTAALIAFLLFLTIRVWVDSGFDFLVLVSVIVLVILGVGVLGAIGSPDE
jgi:hypothetical protein